MKKLLLSVLLAVLGAFSLYAQISVHGWGEAAFVPVYAKGDDLKSIAHVDWAGSPYLGVMVAGEWKNIGLDLGLTFRSEKFFYPGTAAEEFVNLGDKADIWWRPNDYFKMTIGRTTVDRLRGKFGETYGLYSYVTGRISGYDGLRYGNLSPFAQYVSPTASGQYKRFIAVDNQDAIFSRFVTYRTGAVIEITPIEGLFIGLAVSPGMGGKVSIGGIPAALAPYMPELPDLYGGDNLFQEVFESMQAAAGYEIQNIGFVRFGYFGDIKDDPKKNIAVADLEKNKRLETAFAFNGVENLVIDTGFKYFMTDDAEFPMSAAMGVSFQKIPFVLRGRIDLAFGGDNDPRFAFNINPSMFLSQRINTGIDGLFGIQGEDKNLGFDAYVQLLYTNGSVKIGGAITLPMNGEPEKLGWSLPIVFEYWF